MYAEFYKLSGKPFQLSPSPRFFFSSQVHRKAMDYLTYGMHQGEGFIVITGDIGTGKTTLIGYLLEQLDQSKYLAAKLVTTQLEAEDTLRMIASAVGIRTEGMDKATLLRRFETFLLDNQRQGRRVLLFVDECQNLPMRSLEELRMLSNFQSSEIPPIQFFLLGQPQFQGILANENLEQLRQRVTASYHLGPLNSSETQAYIEHRLRMVDWKADPEFTPDAFIKIHQFTSGVARQINTFCDRLLLFGMLEDLHQIDASVVESVAADMLSERAQIQPTPTQSMTLQPAVNAASTQDVVKNNGTSAFEHKQNIALGRQRDDIARLEQRIAELDRQLQGHAKTLRRFLQVVMNYFASQNEIDKDGSE